MSADRDGDTQATVVLLGGEANTVSVARSFGRRGIPVVVVARKSCHALKSRYVHPIVIPEGASPDRIFTELLLAGSRVPAGSVIFPCEDAAILFVANNKAQLQERYRLDIQYPEHQLQLLDKELTLSLARKAGVGAPQSWQISSRNDIARALPQVHLPVLLKPIHSHLFQQCFGKKLFQAETSEEVTTLSEQLLDADIQFMLCEYIPGPDTLLNSYYVYIDENNQRLFEFTKRVIRRSPPNFGGGSYHITEWLPETAEQGYKFFSAIGFRGLGNIEFKTDTRDGKLKIIECNARFTGAQELITRSGLDMPYRIYRYLTTGEATYTRSFKDFVTLWLPFKDFDAFRTLKKRGEITCWQWLCSIFRHQTFCYLSLRDPKPFFSAIRSEWIYRWRMLSRK